MMQAASDIYLGWTQAKLPALHHFYWRQLRDMKGSPDVEAMAPATLAFYGRACGWTLARAHARSGDPIAIAAYLGESDQVRPVDGRLLRALRRPERAGPPGLRQGHRFRTAAGPRGRLRAGRQARRSRWPADETGDGEAEEEHDDDPTPAPSVRRSTSSRVAPRSRSRAS